MNFLNVLIGAVAVMSGLLSAQEETASHRALYQTVNGAVATMKSVTAAHKGREGEVQLKGWADGTGVRKIVVSSADGTTEYYLEKEQPVFVFRVFKGVNGAKIEERLYFRDGAIFKWLTTEKNAPVFHAEDYQATTEAHVQACREFVVALTKGKEGKVAEGKAVEGVFLGLEQGDYTHWKMKSNDGSERSFFVLRTDDVIDKVVENPERYRGKVCRVKWKKSIEDIPEAGGKMEIEQVVGVEWVE